MNDNGKGIFVISLDFELQYGIEDHTISYINRYKKNIYGAREAIPKMLELFTKYGIHATWATVGMLLAEDKDDLIGYIQYANEQCGKEFPIQAYINNIGENGKVDKCHYATTLTREIVQTDGQEVASHTFSHYYCAGKGSDKGIFRADLKTAQKIMKDKLNIIPQTIIFPRNQVQDDFLQIASEAGFLNYRGLLKLYPYYKVKNSYFIRALRLLDSYSGFLGMKAVSCSESAGMINIPASSFLRPYNHNLRYLEKRKLETIKKDMKIAAREGKIYHLWWHPHNYGTYLHENMTMLKEVLEYYKFLNIKYGMSNMNMQEVANCIR